MSRSVWSLLILLFAVFPAQPARLFRAGASAVDISPQRYPIYTSGGFLASLAERLDGARLWARALALDDGRTRIVIAVVDSLMLPRELLDRVKQAAARSTGVAVERMLISATHTHSAPSAMGALGTDADPEYIRFLELRLIEAIEGAASNLQPARIGFAVVDAPGLTHCRRWILRPDRVRNDPFGNPTVRANMHPGYQHPDSIGPAGPVDSGLSLLSVQSADGRPMALLANYSMHYVGAGGRVVSADYFGPFVENLERRIGGMAMMSQGTSGDQHWMDYSRPKKDMNLRIFADALAAIALEAYRKIRHSSWVSLDMREEALSLGRRVPGARRLEWARLAAPRAGELPRNQQEVYAREQILLDENPARELKLQAIRIGGLGVTAIPNEVFGITGLKIKAQSPLQPTFNIELANGAEGYIPPPEQHALGGYTTWPARTAGLETSAEPRIVETVLSLLEQVSGRRRRPAGPAPDAYAKAVLASKPLAYWRAQEFSGPGAQDSTGQGHRATYEDGIVFYLEGPRGGRAPHFAGGRMKALLPGIGARYTVEMWFWNGLPAGVRPVTGYLFDFAGDRLALNREGKLEFSRGGTILTGPAPVPLKTWTRVVLTRDGEKAAAWLDGKAAPEFSGNAGEPPEGRSTELFIGGSSTNAANFEGRIGEIAVFARALAPPQLRRP